MDGDAGEPLERGVPGFSERTELRPIGETVAHREGVKLGDCADRE
jgi:hypothetical protein